MFRALALLALTILLSCAVSSTHTLPDGFPAPVRRAAPLGPRSGDRPAPRMPGAGLLPLEVVHHSPKKLAEGASAILVTFDQPMVALGPSPDPQQMQAKHCPIRVTPKVAGRCRWVAGDTLKLALSSPLNNAHTYRVTVPTTLHALSGARLRRPFVWSFETPRPELVGVSLHPVKETVDGKQRFIERARRLRPEDSLLLTFNVQVDPAAVARHARVTANGRVLTMAGTRYEKDDKRVLLRPTRPFPVAAVVKLLFPAGFGSPEGPLASRRVSRHEYEVRGPLRLSVACDGKQDSPDHGCWPMSNHFHAGVTVQFTEPVRRSALRRVLGLTPAAPPLRPVWRTWCGGKDPCSRNWRFSRVLRPRQRYRLSVGQGLRDIFGEKITGRRTASFRTSGFPPGIFLPRDDEGVREAWQPYRLRAINVKQIDVALARHTGAALVRLVECLRLDHHRERCGDPPDQQRTLRIHAGRDRLVQRRLPLPSGLVQLTVTSPQLVDYEGKPVVQRRVALQTNLGLNARLTAFGVATWVTSLDRGRPLGGVRVELRDEQGQLVWQGTTDAQGVAEASRRELGQLLTGKAPPRLYVLASHRGDLAYLTPGAHGWHQAHRWWDWRDDLGEQEQREPPLPPQTVSDFHEWVGERPVLVGYLSSERGIYRPGQVVHAHGAARRYVTWKGTPVSGERAVVRLLNPEGQLVAKREVTLSELGVFRAKLPVPAAGRLGYHRLTLNLGQQQLASYRVKVAEYRAPSFAVSLSTRPRQLAAGRDRVELRGSASYLFGGALDGGAYRLQATRGEDSLRLPPDSGYRVGSHRWGHGERWLSRRGTLDAGGRLSLSAKLPPLRHHFPELLRFELEVAAPDGATVARTRMVTRHPGALYAAYKTLPDKDNRARQLVRVVDTHGKPQSGHQVTARLYPYDKKGQPVLTTALWSATFDVPADGRRLEVPWPQGHDDYSAELVLSVTDAAGREAWSTRQIYRPSSYSVAVGRIERMRRARDAQLTVTTDRERYLPGQTARVTVRRRGVNGPAVLYLERERIFDTRPLRFDARGVATAELKVLSAFARGVTLRAVVLRQGRRLRDPLGPLVTATAELRVSDKPFHLRVKLDTDRPVYRPRQQVKLAVEVRDGLGRPRRAQVVAMAVDEAVLALTDFRLPDPLRQLLHTPAAGVLADDVRRHLVRLDIPVVHRDHTALGLSGFGTGGGGGSGSGYGSGSGSLRRAAAPPGKKRSRFLTTAWHATLLTDEQGRASASFTLPDNLTRYRVMAFAVDSERSAGSGRTGFKVDLPLVTLPVLPRLLRVGDRAEVGVTVQNTDLPASAVTITARIEGDELSLTGKKSRQVTLPRGRSATVRFPVEARGAGEARLVFTISGPGGVSDILEETLPVKQAVLMEAASVSGQTRGAVVQGIAALDALRPDRGGLELSLASTALTGVEDGMEQLIGYPYGCLEQKASRLLPMLAAVALGDRFNLELPGEPRELIAEGLQQVLAMQRGDGGFGYWPGSRTSWPFATAYALVVLHRTRLASADLSALVPDRAVRGAVRYLHKQVDNDAWRRHGGLGYAIQAFLLHALALHGEDVSRQARELFADRHRKPLFARAMLLATLAQLPKRSRRREKGRIATLADELGDSLRVDGTWAHAEENLSTGYQVLMCSSDRATAMVLLALLHARPEHPMVPRLVRWFLLGRKQARFRNTQEAAWALLALWDYARIREREEPDFAAGVWLGGTRLLRASFKGRSVRPVLKQLEMKQLMHQVGKTARELVIAKRGKGTLYYVARLRYARRKLPDRAKDHGLAVTRKVQVLDSAGRPLARQRPPRPGDTLLVTLEVESNEARRYLVVDDPLPAGLEAIDSSLATASRSFGPGGRWRRMSYYDHHELRDDRVLFFRDLMQPGTLTYRYTARVNTPGRFLAPPARAEEMYTPEVYGHTASGAVTYTPR